jgi:hypothetical protein
LLRSFLSLEEAGNPESAKDSVRYPRFHGGVTQSGLSLAGFSVVPCGTGDHQTRNFIGSHGALGGVGWKDVAHDADCQFKVADWMNAAFHSLASQPSNCGAEAHLKV